jgi:pSer/pThr/pTyr-binding forkhead associated (FHA) protein
MTADASPSGQTQWQIKIYNGQQLIDTILVTGAVVTIGRELDNDITLDDLEISRHHARLTRQGNQFILEDLNSANGTFINNAPLTEPYILRAGDAVSLGDFKLKFEEIPLNILQARIPTSVQPAITKPARSLWPWIIAGGVLLVAVLAILAVFAAGWFLRRGQLSPTAEPTPQLTVVANRPIIELTQAPPNNSQVQVNQSMTIQAIASDPSGVSRLELWVNNIKMDQISSSLSQNAPSIAAAFQWSPQSPGDYTLELHAYNQQGLATKLRVSTVTAVGDLLTPTPLLPTFTPAPTFTSLPPTDIPSPTPAPPTPTTGPALLGVKSPVLNVREGPGTQYPQIAQLTQGQEVEIIGQTTNAQGQWWQIALPNGLGWVAGNSDFVTLSNTGAVPVISPPPLSTATPTSTPTATPTPAPAIRETVIRPPDGKTLLIISNRSALNQPARLTLSGGKSVGGGKEFDPPPNGQLEVVLEPDFYRALWSSPARGGFTRGAEFNAIAGKVMVMWIIPEHGLTETEIYDQLTIGAAPTATPAATTGSGSQQQGGYHASPGKALLVAGNRSAQNNFAVITISGGNFGGGQQITLDANTETPLELLPGNYRAVWNTPAHNGFSAGKEFTTSSGEIILSWIIPEDGQVFMQFPGQPATQINN